MRTRLLAILFFAVFVVVGCAKAEPPEEPKQAEPAGTEQKKVEPKKEEAKPAAQPAAPRNKNLLFTIERSKNRNQVVYEARRSGDGFDTKDPIKVYWIMVEKGGKTEGLNAIEKKSAYGISVDSASKDKVVFNLKALKKRTIEAVFDKGQARAVMTINGEKCYLQSVYIEAKERSLNPIPKVLYIDITGVSAETGKPVKEQIKGD